MCEAFRNPLANVRKEVVLCLVETHKVLGDSLLPYLTAHLGATQLKLVTIYINRAMQRRREGGGGNRCTGGSATAVVGGV